MDGMRLPAAVTGDNPRSPRVVLGTILSGDTFLNCDATQVRLHATFNAAAVEMEGGAVAQVCRRFGDVPFVNVRCLSDLAGDRDTQGSIGGVIVASPPRYHARCGFMIAWQCTQAAAGG